jgi:hypothetical protein
LHVAKSTKPISAPDNGGTTRYNTFILAAGDAAVLTGGGGSKSTAGTAADSVISNNSSIQDYYYTRSILNTETAYFDIIKWGANATVSLTGERVQLDRNLLSGKFAVFVRGYATAGVVGNLAIKVTFKEEEDGSSAGVETPYVVGTDIGISPQISANTGVLHYIGEVSIPFSTRRTASLDGFGKLIRQTRDNLSITIAVKNAIGTTRTLVITDLIMMPLDDAYLIAETATGVNGSTLQKFLLDNTGYLNLSNPGTVGVSYVDWSDTGGVAVEVRGQDITLTPGLLNRIHFLVEGSNGTIFCIANAEHTIRLNIVPRWRGVRDV